MKMKHLVSSTLHFFLGLCTLCLGTFKLVIALENLYLDHQDSKIKSNCVISTNVDDSQNSLFLKSADAGCLIEQDGKILFIKGAFNFEDAGRKGMLLFPGGTKRTGEYAACTASRETKEEANLDVVITDVVGVFDNDFILFVCKPKKRISSKDLEYVKKRETEGMEFVEIKRIIKAEEDLLKRFKYRSDILRLSAYYSNKMGNEKNPPRGD
jgi:ADP-ribose pyrophosphatase YjhB (NUDIX family)